MIDVIAHAPENIYGIRMLSWIPPGTIGLKWREIGTQLSIVSGITIGFFSPTRIMRIQFASAKLFLAKFLPIGIWSTKWLLILG
jgi:hypothetical protein